MRSERHLPFWEIASRIVWYLLGVVEVLLAFRFVLRLFAANTAAAFVQFIYSMSDPLVAPFTGIFGTASAEGAVFEPATLLAMAVYAVVAYGIVRLFTLVARPHDEVVQHVEEDRADTDLAQPTTTERTGDREGMYYDHRDHGHPHPV